MTEITEIKRCINTDFPAKDGPSSTTLTSFGSVDESVIKRFLSIVEQSKYPEKEFLF